MRKKYINKIDELEKEIKDGLDSIKLLFETHSFYNEQKAWTTKEDLQKEQYLLRRGTLYTKFVTAYIKYYNTSYLDAMKKMDELIEFYTKEEFKKWQ